MYSGDTIRLIVHFRAFDDTLIDPTNIELKIYDENEQLIETIPIDDSNKESVGIYFYDYTTPEDIKGDIIFEFRGIYNNKPILSRGRIKTKFI